MCSVEMYAFYFACVGLWGEEVKAMCIGSCIIPEAGYAVFNFIFYSFKTIHVSFISITIL